MVGKFLLLLLGQTSGPAQPVRLMTGDIVSVYAASETGASPYSGDYTILSDGSIYGLGFGKLPLLGKTWEQAQALLRASLKRFVLESNVFLAIKKQRAEFVYIVGSNGPGPVPLPLAPTTVRQLLPPLTEKQDGQRLDVEIVREGRLLARTTYVHLLQDGDSVGNIPVRANDLISIVPEPTIRIWVLGAVKSAGQLALPAGSDLYQAIASAGGYAHLDIDTSIVLRRGPNVTKVSSRLNPSRPSIPLLDGDVVTAVVPDTVRITVAGEVLKPGEYAMLDNSTILDALQSASGPLPSGNLGDVLVYRNGELLTFDLSGHDRTQEALKSPIQAGDTVIVRPKLHKFYVFGEVRSAGAVAMDDHKTYFASDALALAGGLNERGTLRRIYLMHPVPNGKPIITQFNLDEYLKDGKQASNPEIRAGDSLLFGQPTGLTLQSVGLVLSSFVVLDSLATTHP